MTRKLALNFALGMAYGFIAIAGVYVAAWTPRRLLRRLGRRSVAKNPNPDPQPNPHMGDWTIAKWNGTAWVSSPEGVRVWNGWVERTIGEQWVREDHE